MRSIDRLYQYIMNSKSLKIKMMNMRINKITTIL